MEEIEVEEEEEMAQHWKTGASSAHPLSKNRNNKGRPAGTGTVSHKRRELYRQRGEAKRIAREKAEEEERKKKAAEDEAAAAKAAEEEKKKAADEEIAAKEEEEQQKKAAEEAGPKAKEEEARKEKATKDVAKQEEATKEEPPEPTLAQRVAKLSLDERQKTETGPKKKENDDVVMDDRNETEKAEALEKRVTKLELESSDGELDCRTARDNQKGRGGSVKLQLGPSKEEEEREKKKWVPKGEAASSSIQPSKKSRASPLRDPTPPAERGKERILDKRTKEASLDQRDVCIDYHNVLEKGGRSTLPM